MHYAYFYAIFIWWTDDSCKPLLQYERKTVGLVDLWDCVAFDEVAGIKFKDKDGIQIMKDYMASGSFARSKEEKAVCLDSGAKKVLIPSTSFVDFASVPADLMSAFQLIPYQSAEDAVYKAFGVE